MLNRTKSRTQVFASNRALVHDPRLSPELVLVEEQPIPSDVYGDDQVISWQATKDKRAFHECQASRSVRPMEGVYTAGMPVETSVPVRSYTVFQYNVDRDTRRYAPAKGTPKVLHGWYRTKEVARLGLVRPIDDALYDAYLVLKAGNNVPKGQNWLRSAIELKDTKQTIKSLLSFLKFGKRAAMHGFSSSARLAGNRLGPNASIAEVAGLYLTWKFGIEPTYKDVKRFLKDLSKSELVVKGVPRHYKKGERLRVGVNIRHSQTDLRSAAGWPGSPSSYSYQKYAGWSMPWFNYGFTASPVGPPQTLKRVIAEEVLGCIFGELAEDVDCDMSFNDTMAWVCPLGNTLWELTPFTFLLDWFLDVGSVIQRIDRTMAVAASRISFKTGVWQSLRQVTQIYQPSLDATVTVEPIRETAEPLPYEWNDEWRITHSFNGVEMRPLRSPIVYQRGIYIPSSSAFAPVFHWPIKGFQLSTGMAMVLSWMKSN